VAVLVKAFVPERCQFIFPARYIPHDKSLPEHSLHEHQPLLTSASKAQQASALLYVFERGAAHLRPSLLRDPFRTHHYPSRSRAYDTPQFRTVLLGMWRRVLHFCQVADRKYDIGKDGNPKCIRGDVRNRRKAPTTAITAITTESTNTHIAGAWSSMASSLPEPNASIESSSTNQKAIRQM
jgi:hypothetical protein